MSEQNGNNKPMIGLATGFVNRTMLGFGNDGGIGLPVIGVTDGSLSIVRKNSN